MSGSIRAEQRAVCACGSKFVRVEEFGYRVPKCPQCGDYPSRLRVNRYLPTMNGTGKKIDIRYSHTGERLTTVWDAIGVMKLIDKEIQDGTFDPVKYGSNEQAKQFQFSNFALSKYIKREESKLLKCEIDSRLFQKKIDAQKYFQVFADRDIRMITASHIQRFNNEWKGDSDTLDFALSELGEILDYAYDLKIIGQRITPFMYFVDRIYLSRERMRYDKGELKKETYRKKTKSYRNHLRFFRSFDIKEISSAKILQFYNNWTGGDRTRDLVISELNTIMDYAEGLDLISKKPRTPKVKQSRRKSSARFLLDNEQEPILNEIEDLRYRAMIQIIFIYALRPCEIRALRWRDIDFKEGVLNISQHFSGNKLYSGRKSNEDPHALPIIQEFLDAISYMPRSIVQDNFVFIGDQGAAVGDRVLARHWNKALEKIKIPSTQLYEGTKHSQLSYLKRLGYSDEEIMLVTGHTSVNVLRRYAQLPGSDRMNKIKEMLNHSSVSRGKRV